MRTVLKMMTVCIHRIEWIEYFFMRGVLNILFLPDKVIDLPELNDIKQNKICVYSIFYLAFCRL